MMRRLVPKLRFDGFSGEWEEKELEKVTVVNMGQSPASSSYNLHGNGMYLIQGNADIQDRKSNPRQWTTEPTKVCSINDLILTVRAPVGHIAKSRHRACIGRGVCSLAEKDNNNLEFIYQFLLSYEKKWISLEQGSTFTAVSGNDIKSLKLMIPKPPEQQKIANCLSSLDALIEAQNKKVEALKKHKKGLMQMLFPKDGEKVPELRFDGFLGEWEEKELENVTVVNMGQSPASSSYNLHGNGMYLIQGNADIQDRKSNPRQWTTEPTKVCSINNLILTVRAPVGHIAKSRHRACIGRGVCSLAEKDNNNLEFIYQFLLSYEKKWISLEQGSTFTAVSGNDIKSLKLMIPKPKEQQKIANTLSSLDALIEAQNNKVEALKKHKKGLMQGLFVNNEGQI